MFIKWMFLIDRHCGRAMDIHRMGVHVKVIVDILYNGCQEIGLTRISI